MANNLKLLRNRAKLSQAALAEIMNTTRNQLAKLEGGRRRLSDVWITRASKALGVDPGELVTDTFEFAPVQISSTNGTKASRPKLRLVGKGRDTFTMVPLIDSIAAGKLTSISSQIPIEDVPLLAFADLGPGEFFATKVDGGSMDRVSPEGSIIIVNIRDRDLVSGKYYAFAHKGAFTYKRWQGGDPEYLEPYSTDPMHKPIFVRRKKDLELVGRVKRTVLDL